MKASSSFSFCVSVVLRKPQTERQLIVTADDFGLSVGVNEAIELAHTGGVLSTASLMMAGDATADAVSRARRLPDLRVGLHLVLVEGATVLGQELIPDLLDENGLLPSAQVRLSLKYFMQLGVRQQLAAEIRAQFEAFRSTGLALDHANAHKHMHLHPTIGKLLILIGREYGLRAVRVPTEPLALQAASGRIAALGAYALQRWSAVLRYQARRAGLVVNDHLFGIGFSGHMTASRVIPALPKLPVGLTEVYFHPASVRDLSLKRLMPEYEHEAEFACLTSSDFKAGIRASRLELTTWAEQCCS